MDILPQSEAVFTVMKDGWHSAETPPNNDQVEWSWTSKNQATIAFKNPKKDAIFYLDLDNPSGAFPEGQHVQVTLGNQTVDDFVLMPARQLRKIPIAAGAFGAEDMVELKVGVDKVFVPAQLNPAEQRRAAAGVRVFHAVIAPTNKGAGGWGLGGSGGRGFVLRIVFPAASAESLRHRDAWFGSGPDCAAGGVDGGADRTAPPRRV